MEVLESALLAELAEFIDSIKSNSSVRAVVDAAEGGAGAAMRDESFLSSLQVLRSEALRGKEKEVLDATAVASSARGFLAGFKALFLCCAEMDRLAARATAAAAAEDDMDVDVDAGTQEDMDVDGRPAPGARASAGSIAALFPSSGAKRKSAFGGGGGGEVDTVRPHKRQLLKWMRLLQWQRSCSGRVSSASRRSRHARTVARSRTRRPIGKPDARTMALAKSRIDRRIGKPTTTRRRSQPSLGHHFSRISL